MKVLIAGASGVTVEVLTSLCVSQGYPYTVVDDMDGLDAFMATDVADVACLSHYLQDGSCFDVCKRLRSASEWRYQPIVLVMDRPSQVVIEKAFNSGFSETFDIAHSLELQNFLKNYSVAETQQQGRVLLVEDSLSQQEFVSSVLRARGLETTCCLDVDSAEARLKTESFDLLVTDIVLEGNKTGLELIQSVRRMPEGIGDIPIIVMSSHKDVSQKLGPFRLGADDYIAKPLDAEEFVARVNRLLRARSLMLKVKEQQVALEQNNLAMKQMLGRVSHECRNSINVILGLSSMILRKETMGEKFRSKIEIIGNASRHQLSLLDDILDFTKLESGQIDVSLTDVALAAVIEDATSMFRYKCADMGLELSVELADDLPETLKLDERLVKQILINLLNNAVKFTSKGFVRVGVRLLGGSDLIFSVTDSGPGVPESEKALLFQAFKQTAAGKNKKSSSGLGLSLCRGFATVMGGRMEVESTEGGGSTFSLVLPLSV